MPTTHRLLFALAVLCEFVYSQRFPDDVCTLKITGLQGVCKLLSDCQHAREELQKHNRSPQTCGFAGTHPIVCCPKTNSRPPGEISKRKCKEYARYAFERKTPVLLIKPPELTINKCGHSVINIGGELAGRKEFPHMAALGYEPTPGDIQWLCGGTLLNREYILTAAHCLSSNTQGDALWVKIGVADLEDSSHAQVIKIAERIPYPQYKSSSYYHDIGLIKLKTAATLNTFARPACLYLEPEVSTEKAIVTGWETTRWVGQGNNRMLKFTIDLYDNNYCNSSYKNQISRKLKNGIVNDIQLCAGSESGEKDTCQGDSGGPLQIYHIGDDVKCMYDIVGIASFGKACSRSLSVYVRVSHYVKWIEDIVWPEV